MSDPEHSKASRDSQPVDERSEARVTEESPVRLTQLAACAGCAAKLSQTMLRDVLRRLAPDGAPGGAENVLVDASTFDDAGVYQLTSELALVHTVDFFTPIVDEPYAFGQIAAANALSDVYAMGGRPISALNILAIPPDRVGPKAVAEILAGGAEVARRASCVLLGGHTIKTLEPIYGLCVTGTVHPRKMLTNATARPGDLLVLTKPLGVGIATTAAKRGIASPGLTARAIDSMRRLNSTGALLAERGICRCATDVTGFGLMGHLANIVRASGVGAEVVAQAVPVLDEQVLALIEGGCVPGGTLTNLEAAEGLVDWGTAPDHLRILLADAQTSGPLLLCIAPSQLHAALAVLKQEQTLAAAVIGRIVDGPSHIVVV